MDKIIIKDYLDDPQVFLDEIFKDYKYNHRYDRYDNPFERKWVMRRPFPSVILHVTDRLIRPDTCWWVQRLLDVPIEYGDVQHYGGVFVYGITGSVDNASGDYLKPHCDAGVHPYNGQHKVATACLYLTPAVLYFYKGDPVWFDKPLVHRIDQVLHIPANSLVLFTNHDTAWHEVPLSTTNQPRAVITVSYMAPSDFKDPRFMNTRTRAYFARHMSVLDSPELAELRELRASEEHHQEVYRTTTLSEAPAATQDWPLNL